MKSIVNHLFLYAAAALSLGTVAYGQNIVKTEVPFAFQIPGVVSPAGNYTVRVDGVSSAKTVRLVNRDTGRSVMAMSQSLTRYSNTQIAPRLVFKCGETGCALSEVWTPAGGYSLPVSYVRGPQYTASIPLDFSRN